MHFSAKNKCLFLISALLYIVLHGYSQSSVDDYYILNGYANKIAGDDYIYHSSVPQAEKSMIVRATDGNYSMEWTTDTLPYNVEQKYVVISWLAGIGSSPGLSEMKLTYNNSGSFIFLTDGRSDWNNKGQGGSELSFHAGMTDQFGDKFGFMRLKIPTRELTPGKPLTLKVTGGDFGRTSWYMTFKMPVKTHVNLKVFPALLKDSGKNNQLVSGGILYMGEKDTLFIYSNKELVKKQEVVPGYNYLRFGIPEVSKETSAIFDITAGNYKERLTLQQVPVRKWKVDFIQHSHTDIGYTRSQTEILAEHVRYIDYALDYCDATDSYPEDSKFRWTCESSWAVDEFLKTRPAEQIERLKERVKEGRIELTAMYFNFDDLPDEQTLAASLMPLKRFREAGLISKTAMQNDVNGIGWCLNDYYHDLGVKYLNMGTHGHRALICFDKPTLFWWESPSGNRMLAFRAEHYMTGNTVFQMDKGDIANFEYRFLSYLIELQQKGYTYDEIAIQHSGYLTDNSPPSTIASDLIKQWDELYEWPRLKTSTTTPFFETMESRYADSFPAIRGAWPDWWTDGFGASAREVAAIRKAQSDISAFSAGLVMSELMGSQLPEISFDRINEVNNALLFYTEHTVGYSESVREPYHEQTMEQRAIKESYAWEAYRKAKTIGEEAMGLLQSHFYNEPEPSLVVFNTLNWIRDGLVLVYIDHQIMPRGIKPKITDVDGRICPVQPLSHRSDGTYWAVWVDDLPAFGYKKLVLSKGPEMNEGPTNTLKTSFENQWYKVEINPQKGTIISWFDKDLNTELVDEKAKYAMGEFIYELLGNRYQMEQKKLDDFKRISFDSAWFESYTAGDIYNTIRLQGRTSASIDGYNTGIEIRLFNTNKRIDLAYSIVKKAVIEPEGIYIAFPFSLENGKHFIEVQGGTMQAGKDQIPGSSNDWNAFQNFTSVRNSTHQIVMTSVEVPLIQPGNINTGRFQASAVPESSQVFSWPMNNYWVTNFNPDQRGEHKWLYSLTSGDDVSNEAAVHFGWEIRTPFLTRVLPGGGKGDIILEKSLISGWPDNILLVNAKPGQKGEILLHVREINGNEADISKLEFTGKDYNTSTRVDVTGKALTNGSLVLKPFESAFFSFK